MDIVCVYIYIYICWYYVDVWMSYWYYMNILILYMDTRVYVYMDVILILHNIILIYGYDIDVWKCGYDSDVLILYWYIDKSILCGYVYIIWIRGYLDIIWILCVYIYIYIYIYIIYTYIEIICTLYGYMDVIWVLSSCSFFVAIYETWSAWDHFCYDLQDLVSMIVCFLPLFTILCEYLLAKCCK